MNPTIGAYTAPAVDTINPEITKVPTLSRNTLMPTMLAALSFCRMQRRPQPNFEFAISAGGEGNDSQHPHGEIEEQPRRAWRAGQDRDVHADGAAGQYFPVVGDFAHHLDHCDCPDRKIVAAQDAAQWQHRGRHQRRRRSRRVRAARRGR